MTSVTWIFFTWSPYALDKGRSELAFHMQVECYSRTYVAVERIELPVLPLSTARDRCRSSRGTLDRYLAVTMDALPMS